MPRLERVSAGAIFFQICGDEMKGNEEEWTLEDLLRFGREMEQSPERIFELASSYLKVRDRNGAESALVANRVQRVFEHHRGRHNIVLKARQMGISTWIAARFFLKTITARGVLTVQVAHTREAAESIFRMAQRFWECLPEKLRDGPLRRSKSTSGQMRFAELDSEFRVMSAGDEGAGRGITMQNLHCSELSRWPRAAAETLAGLRAALVPGGELVIESTPNGAWGCFFEEWQRAAEPGSGVAQHFFPWWMEEAYVSDPVTDCTEEESALMGRHNLTPAQIGFRRQLAASYRGLRAQEFAEDAVACFRASGDCCFEIEAIEKRLTELWEPVEQRHNGALHIWWPPVKDRKYLVAVDTAGGSPDGDFAAMQVIDLRSGTQCAELQQRIGMKTQAEVAVALATEYNNAVLVVERNNHGAGVLAYLEKYGNLYAPDGIVGWLTTAANKPAMIATMGRLLVESAWMFRSRRLLGECRSYQLLEGGRTGAANGAHDDLVMAMAIAQMVRAESSF